MKNLVYARFEEMTVNEVSELMRIASGKLWAIIREALNYEDTDEDFNEFKEEAVRAFLTFNGIFSQFLGFMIPLIIFGPGVPQQ